MRAWVTGTKTISRRRAHLERRAGEEELVLGGEPLELAHEQAVGVLEAVALVDDHVLVRQLAQRLALPDGDLEGGHDDGEVSGGAACMRATRCGAILFYCRQVSRHQQDRRTPRGDTRPAELRVNAASDDAGTSQGGGARLYSGRNHSFSIAWRSALVP